MNSDILKPYFDTAVLSYPDQPIRVVLAMERGADGSMRDSKYSALVIIGATFGFAETLEEAFQRAVDKFNPESAARKKAAAELREKADRIENGTEPV